MIEVSRRIEHGEDVTVEDVEEVVEQVADDLADGVAS